MSDTTYTVRPLNPDEGAISLTAPELQHLLSTGDVDIRATKIRGSVMLSLAAFYDDGMGGASGHSGKSAERLRKDGHQ